MLQLRERRKQVYKSEFLPRAPYAPIGTVLTLAALLVVMQAEENSYPTRALKFARSTAASVFSPDRLPSFLLPNEQEAIMRKKQAFEELKKTLYQEVNLSAEAIQTIENAGLHPSQELSEEAIYENINPKAGEKPREYQYRLVLRQNGQTSIITYVIDNQNKGYRAIVFRLGMGGQLTTENRFSFSNDFLRELARERLLHISTPGSKVTDQAMQGIATEGVSGDGGKVFTAVEPSGLVFMRITPPGVKGLV